MILRDDYDVVTASNGSQALDYLDNSEFDLAILDIRMPDINGIELLEKVKEGSGDRGGDDHRLCFGRYGNQRTAQRCT